MTGTADVGGGATHDHRSRWPVVAAVGAGVLYFGGGMALLASDTDAVPGVLGVGLLFVGVAGLVAGLAGWAREAFVGGGGRAATRYEAGMVVFLGTDVATFGALFAYYFFVRAGEWPPGPELPDLLGSLVLVNTVVLLASSATLHYAHEALAAGDHRRFQALLGATLALGVAFVTGQAVEYYEFVVEGFTLTSGVFASAFYGLTGLHGLHVSLGAVFLGVVFVRSLRGRYAADRDVGVRTVSLYWHFVDAVWVFLFLVLYVGATL